MDNGEQQERKWSALYVTHTTLLFGVWLICGIVCLLFRVEMFIAFIVGSVFAWLIAVFTSRATGEPL